MHALHMLRSSPMNTGIVACYFHKRYVALCHVLSFCFHLTQNIGHPEFQKGFLYKRLPILMLSKYLLYSFMRTCLRCIIKKRQIIHVIESSNHLDHNVR